MGLRSTLILLAAAFASNMGQVAHADLLNDEGQQYRAALKHGDIRLNGEYRIFRESPDVLGFQDSNSGSAIGKQDSHRHFCRPGITCRAVHL